jgi:hypothetical protein
MHGIPLPYQKPTKSISLCVVGIGLLAFTSFNTPPKAAWTAQLVGTYQGRVEEGRLDPAITAIGMDWTGHLVGDYAINEPGVGIYHGTLEETALEPDHTVVFKWHDRYGNGTLRVKYDEKKRTFDGKWTGGCGWEKWSGRKIEILGWTDSIVFAPCSSPAGTQFLTDAP